MPSLTARTPVLVAIDQGSGSTRVLGFESTGRRLFEAKVPVTTRAPHPGWVEHVPDQLAASASSALLEAVRNSPRQRFALGLSTQRSTVLLWDRRSGRVLTPALSWQDRRAVDVCRALETHAKYIRQATGLFLSPHYAAPKIRWLLDRLPNGQRRAEDGDVVCGTVNTFLLWRLSGGSVFCTDHTNAGRTLLMNLKTLTWDPRLCGLFGIPVHMLPEIRPTVSEYTEIRLGKVVLPVFASVGDQQAAAIGQGVSNPGDLCLNYGTGAFVLRITGERLHRPRRLLSNVAWSHGAKRTYLVEGGVNAVGSGLRWLLDSFRLQWTLRTVDRRAGSARPGVRVLPSFGGLAAPYWRPEVSAMMSGLSLSTKPEELLYGFLEGVAFLVSEVVAAGASLSSARRIVAGGGLSILNTLVRLQADYLQKPVQRSPLSETTAWGASILAGLGAGVWLKMPTRFQTGRLETFYPQRSSREVREEMIQWRELLVAATKVSRSL